MPIRVVARNPPEVTVGYHVSTLAELARARARGQRPDAFVVVGDGPACAWAARNAFFAVDVRDCGEDLDAFTALDVVVRMRDPRPHRELVQRLALTARFVTVFDTTTGHAEFVRAA